jgi:hypothetical protein
MERVAIEGQNLQLFHSGLGAASHYEQLLLAICEGCKLE